MGKSILVVDAPEASLHPLVQALGELGYLPTVMHAGDHPVEQFSKHEYELVFVSQLGINAKAICAGIRQTAEGAITPVIFVGTGKEAIKSPADALSGGGDYYFSLPLDMTRVLAKVHTYVGPATPDAHRAAPPPPKPPAFGEVATRSSAATALAGAADAVLAKLANHEAELSRLAEAARQRDQEEEKERQEQERQARKQAEEQRRREAEEEAQRRSAEEEMRRRSAEQQAFQAAEAARKKAEREVDNRQAELEAARATLQEEQKRQVAEAQHKRQRMEAVREAQQEARQRAAAEARSEAVDTAASAQGAFLETRDAHPGAAVSTGESALHANHTQAQVERPMVPAPAPPTRPERAARPPTPRAASKVEPRAGHGTPRAERGSPDDDNEVASSGAIQRQLEHSESASPMEQPPIFRPLQPESGTLSAQFDVAALFAALYRQEVTGRIELTRGDEHRSVQVEAGMPVDADSDQPFDRIEEYLYREGKITQSQYQGVRLKRLHSARQVGAYLVSANQLKPEELFAAVRGHLEEHIYTCFEWEEGTYRYLPQGVREAERVRLDLDPRALIMEGIRRKYLLPRLVAGVGSPSSLVALTDRAGDALPALRLGSREQAVARLLDGQRNLEDVVFSAGMEPLRVYHVVHALITVGAAEVLVRGLDGLRAPNPNADAIDRGRIADKLEQVRDSDYFQILGVPRTATAYEIERACAHVDQIFAANCFSVSVQQEMAGPLQEIAEVLADAREVLSDATRREAYARHLP